MDLLPCTWAGQVESNPLDYHVVDTVQVQVQATESTAEEEEEEPWCSVM